jgi:Icc-related predicted phosphoesterase
VGVPARIAEWAVGSACKDICPCFSQRLESGPLTSVRSRGTIAADLERLAALSDPAKTVYVTHSPPWGTSLDRMWNGTSVGSRAIRAFIERHRPPLTLHGHIHESPGVERIGPTVSVNPGDSLSRLRAVRVDLGDLSVIPLR